MCSMRVMNRGLLWESVKIHTMVTLRYFNFFFMYAIWQIYFLLNLKWNLNEMRFGLNMILKRTLLYLYKLSWQHHKFFVFFFLRIMEPFLIQEKIGKSLHARLGLKQSKLNAVDYNIIVYLLYKCSICKLNLFTGIFNLSFLQFIYIFNTPPLHAIIHSYTPWQLQAYEWRKIISTFNYIQTLKCNLINAHTKKNYRLSIFYFNLKMAFQ